MTPHISYIQMSDPMVRALLWGFKFQTRRIPAAHWRKVRPGSWLYVRETWQTGVTDDGPQIAYRATADIHEIDAWDGPDFGAGPSFNNEKCPKAHWETWLPDLICGVEGRWRPAIFHPRWATRLSLKVTDVRTQRLQDLSRQDAIDEGLKSVSKDRRLFKYGIPERDGLPGAKGWQWQDWDSDPVRAFARLWDSLHGKKSGEAWADNPDIIAVSFEVHKTNIETLFPHLADQAGKAA